MWATLEDKHLAMKGFSCRTYRLNDGVSGSNWFKS